MYLLALVCVRGMYVISLIACQEEGHQHSIKEIGSGNAANIIAVPFSRNYTDTELKIWAETGAEPCNLGALQVSKKAKSSYSKGDLLLANCDRLIGFIPGSGSKIRFDLSKEQKPLSYNVDINSKESINGADYYSALKNGRKIGKIKSSLYDRGLYFQRIVSMCDDESNDCDLLYSEERGFYIEFTDSHPAPN